MAVIQDTNHILVKGCVKMLQIGGKNPIPLMVIISGKKIATGTIDVYPSGKHYHVNLDKDTYGILLESKKCEIKVTATVEGIKTIMQTDGISIGDAGAVLIEDVLMILEI